MASRAAGRMAILHCHSTFSLGGKEARAVRLMNAFGPRARHTILSAMPDELGARAAIDPAVSADFPIEGRAPALHGKPGPARYLALARYMQGFDLVLTYNWGSMDAVMAHRLCRTVMPLPPLVHHEDGFNADEADRRNWKRNTFRRVALPTASALVVPSATLGRIARDEWNVERGLTRIGNGIATARYRQRPAPDAIPGLSRDKRDNGDIVVGTIAGLRAVKDLPLLVEACALAARQTPVRLVIVGEGPEREAILAAAARHGFADRLLMPGFLPDPARYAGLFDMLALSSLSEQQPIAVMEAMAAGLPVVAPAVGDIAAMVAADNARFITTDRSAATLARSIVTLAGSGALRRDIGQANAAKAAAEHDEGVMIARYAALYARVAGVEPAQLLG